MILGRRSFLSILGTTTGAAALGIFPVIGVAQVSSNKEAGTKSGPFQLDPLPYAYDALEPHIDAATMRFHHNNHYATYIKNLNEAVSKYPQLQSKSAEALLGQLSSIPEDIRTTVRNNGGGYVNHKMYWEIMGPSAGGAPSGAIAEAINKTFGSFDTFKQQFNQAGVKRFGSGWAWLVRNKQGNLQVISTANQDSPLLEGLYPIMGNDVWEHAYYLKYQYRRADYLSAWWNVVNWSEVNKRFQQASA